jgi:hypothetical protein
MNWKEFGKKRSWPNFNVLSLQSPAGPVKNHKNPQSGQPVSDLNPEPPEYEAGVFTTWPRCSVHNYVFSSTKREQMKTSNHSCYVANTRTVLYTYWCKTIHTTVLTLFFLAFSQTFTVSNNAWNKNCISESHMHFTIYRMKPPFSENLYNKIFTSYKPGVT